MSDAYNHSLEAIRKRADDPFDVRITPAKTDRRLLLNHIDALTAALARVTAERDESDAVLDRLARLLAESAVALRGPEPPLTRWSWADVPERIAALQSRLTAAEAERDRAREALREAREKAEDWHEQIMDTEDGSTVFGYCRECGTVEYREHKPDCAYVALIARIDAALAPAAAKEQP